MPQYMCPNVELPGFADVLDETERVRKFCEYIFAPALRVCMPIASSEPSARSSTAPYCSTGCTLMYTYPAHQTLKVIKECFEQFSLEEVFLAFNGGKDCTVLLDITIKILKEKYPVEEIENKFKVLYIRTNSPFQEIEEFSLEIENHYRVKLVITEGPMKDTLKKLLEGDKRLKACLMGTRRTDPFSNELNFVQKTDANWPQMLRVSPVLNWSYHQIWSYILQRGVPYCNLYDKGYTSVGSINDTWPNPSLGYKDVTGKTSYHPAWRLSDGTLERAGRGSKPSNGYHNGIATSEVNG